MTTPAPRRAKLYPTPDDAETAFYEAFERSDLVAMMAVWAATDDVVCVHPQGPRLTGFEAVRESWARIFTSGTQMRIRATEVRRFDGNNVSVHAVVELVAAAGQQAPAQTVSATNVYELTDGGWRMVVHHATLAPEPQPSAEEPPRPSHTLH